MCSSAVCERERDKEQSLSVCESRERRREFEIDSAFIDSERELTRARAGERARERARGRERGEWMGGHSPRNWQERGSKLARGVVSSDVHDRPGRPRIVHP
eukprot:6175740-Pleurochrysis_carterae.AAC.2